jgi:hypothetical protein
MRLEDVILRDTRANQPVATAVAAGTIYFVTDELAFERSNGTIWQDITPAAVGGAPDNATYIVQVATGTLSAEQALGALATGLMKSTTTTGVISIAVADTDYAAATHAARHLSGGADAIKIDDLAAGDDNTDLNVSTTKHGLAPKLSNVSTEYLSGTGVYSTPAGGGGGSDWDVEVVKSIDQDVITGSITLESDTELIIPMLTGEIWLVQLILIYSGGSTTSDYKANFVLPTALGWVRYTGINNASDAILVSTGIRFTGATALTDIVCGTATLGVTRMLLLDLFVKAGANGDLVFQFANSSATGSQTARTHAGSILRGKKIIG